MRPLTASVTVLLCRVSETPSTLNTALVAAADCRPPEMVVGLLRLSTVPAAMPSWLSVVVPSLLVTSARLTTPPVLPVPESGVEADTLSALGNLGYRRVEAAPVVTRVLARLGEGAATGEVIREALRELAPR